MWELDYKEIWVLKSWCFWTVVLEKTLESPLDCKEIESVHSEDQPWDFFGRNDAKAETPVLWPPHVKSWLIGKDSDAGRDWGQEEGDDRGWDGCMASLTQWTWVWVNSGFWWWTVRPHVLRFMGLQWVGTTEQMNWTELNWRTYHVLGIILKSFHIKCHFYFYEHHVLGISTPRFYRCVKWDSENLIDFPRFLQWQRNLNATQFESVQPPCLCICHILPSINVSFVNYFKYSKSAASAVLMEVLLFILYYQTKKEVFQVSFCHSKIFQVGKKKMYCLRASCYEPARANYTYLFPGPCLVASG